MQSAVAAGPWERDPFHIPPVSESERLTGSHEGFQLGGIIPGRAATINGEPVGVGEEFQGYILREAGDDTITLEKDGQSFILTLPEGYPDES